MSETLSAMDAWSHLLEEKKIADFFKGMFDNLGIRIKETGEAFSVEHQGDKFALTDGIDEGKVDYLVDIEPENVENMVKHGEDGEIDRVEAFRIVSVLFTPLTKVSLKNPWMSNGLLRRLGRIENLIHVYLLDPGGGEANTHTLIHLNGEWLTLGGLHGTPKRTFRIDIDQSVEYQKKVFEAMKKNTFMGWVKFGSWYRGWRKAVSA